MPPDLALLSTLELPLFRTSFHGPKGVRAIEVRLYFTPKTCAFSKVKLDVKQKEAKFYNDVKICNCTQGCHCQEKMSGKGNFFQVREKSGNFVNGQGNLERT